MSRTAFEEMATQILSAFRKSDLSTAIQLMEHYFGEERFSFWQLFRDEKRKILQQISEQGSKLIDTAFREIFNDGYQLMTAIQLSNIPLPEAYQSAAQFVLNQDLHQFFIADPLNIRELNKLENEFTKWGITLNNAPSMQLVASERIYSEIQNIEGDPDNSAERLLLLNQVLRTLSKMPIEINYWKSQNLYFSAFNNKPKHLFKSRKTTEAFLELGQLLGIQVENLPFEMLP